MVRQAVKASYANAGNKPLLVTKNRAEELRAYGVPEELFVEWKNLPRYP